MVLCVTAAAFSTSTCLGPTAPSFFLDLSNLLISGPPITLTTLYSCLFQGLPLECQCSPAPIPLFMSRLGQSSSHPSSDYHGTCQLPASSTKLSQGPWTSISNCLQSWICTWIVSSHLRFIIFSTRLYYPLLSLPLESLSH